MYSGAKAVCQANAMGGTGVDATTMRAKLTVTRAVVREEHLAVLFLTSCDEKRHLKDLSRTEKMGNYKYVTTTQKHWWKVLNKPSIGRIQPATGTFVATTPGLDNQDS